MDLNLLYSGYATKQLLLMLTEARTGKHSPEAIAVIKEILSKRTLTEDEQTALYGKPAAQATQPAAATLAFTAATPSYGQRHFNRPEEEVTEPYTNSETVTLFRWLIVLAVGIPTLFQLIGMMSTYQTANAEENVDWLKLSFVFIGNFLFIGAAITGMVFFVRQRKLGWYFLGAFSAFKTVSLIVTILVMISMDYIEATKILMVMLVFTGGVMVLLLLPSITRSFHVKRVPAAVTLSVASFVALLLTAAQFADYFTHGRIHF